MGLDMYLKASEYVSGWEHSPEESRARYRDVLKLADLDGLADPNSPGAEVFVTCAYWRKANQIHKWFVDHVQGGKDECQQSYVDRETLERLKVLCESLLEKRTSDPAAAKALAEEQLPPESGFFFGGTEIDEWYWYDIESTIEQLTRVLAGRQDVSFYYQSSW